MATSGTAAWAPDIAELIEEAYERAGIEIRTGYDFKTARRSLNMLMLEWANRGINLWTVDQQVLPFIQGQATYTLPADTVDLIEHVIRNQGVDITIARISLPTYSSIPVKTTQGRPVQLYINRQVSNPNITVWPVPDSNNYTLIYWRLRRLQDAGDLGINTMDVPFRFIPALVAGLAFHLAAKRPESMQLVPSLKAYYEELFDLAIREDREKTVLRLVPDGRYFR